MHPRLYAIIKSFYSVANDTEEYFYRKACRYYSEKFSTPLIEVLKMSQVHVFLNYYESILDSKTDEEFFDAYIETLRPDLIKENEEEINKIVDIINKRESLRKQSLPKAQNKQEEPLPSISFEYEDSDEDDV
jgi:hypothetical protein